MRPLTRCIVDYTVDLEVASFHGRRHFGVLAERAKLFEDVEFHTRAIALSRRQLVRILLLCRAQGIKFTTHLGQLVLPSRQGENKPQPRLFQAFSSSSVDDATSVMSTYDNVLDLQKFQSPLRKSVTCSGTNLEIDDGVSHARVAGQVPVQNHIPEVPVLEHFVGEEAEHTRLLDTAIAAAYPEDLFRRSVEAGYELGPDMPNRVIRKPTRADRLMRHGAEGSEAKGLLLLSGEKGSEACTCGGTRSRKHLYRSKRFRTSAGTQVPFLSQTRLFRRLGRADHPSFGFAVEIGE